MGLILTRSPYFISREDLDDGATLKLEIGYYDDDLGGLNTQKTYNLTFRSSYLMDISPLLRDYLGDSYEYSGFSGAYLSTISGNIVSVRITLSGDVNGVAQSDVITSYFVTDGYLYSTDDYNEDLSSKLKENCYYAGSTDLVYKLDDSDLALSFLATDVDIFSSNSSESVTVNYMKDGEVVESNSITFSYDYTQLSQIKTYSSNSVSFLQRVELDSGVMEGNNCLDNFFDEVKTQDYDEVMLALGDTVKIIKVKTIEECKHKPYRVTFLNRYGVEEDLWFFKRSDTNIAINKETYRGNSLGMYSAGDGVKTMNHFNVNGYEKIILNSGFVEEEMNEAFRQLLLSEDVTLYDFKENRTYNVNIGTSELQYKSHVNDKLINYAIEFEFAHEVINNVG